MRLPNSVLILLCFVTHAWAQADATPEFRIESQIYGSQSDQPVSQNVTLFTRGLVFDFQMSSDSNATLSEIVVFNERQRTLTLLKPATRQMVELSDLQLLKMNDQLRKEIQQNSRAGFLINEPFTEEHDWSSDRLVLSSDTIRYTVKGQRPKDATILPRYYDFLNQFTRLKASDPSSLPPFPRMKLNQSLQKMGWVPTELSMRIQPNAMFSRTIEAQSRHALMMSLSDLDRQRIQLARNYLGQFESVGLPAYRGIAAKPKRLLSSAKNNFPAIVGSKAENTTGPGYATGASLK